jgi:sec-independent protein translocase protein TatA
VALARIELHTGQQESLIMAVGPWQIIIIAAVVVLLFGASRFADLGKGIGEGIKNFKKGITEDPDAEAKASSDETAEQAK